MPNTNSMTGAVKKELHIFYLLDTSGSMNGLPIAALNDAMRSTVRALYDKFHDNPDVTLKIAVLQYASGAEWITLGNNHLEDIEYFVWDDLKAGGMTYMGAALDKLREGLSRNTMMNSATGNKVPVIIFMTDGQPNDNWEEALQKIQANNWFQSAIRIGIALGKDANEDVLAQIVGSREGVIKAQELDKFADMIRIVSVVSTLRGSVSQVAPPTSGEILKQVQEELNEAEAASVPASEPDQAEQAQSADVVSVSADAVSVSADADDDWGNPDLE